MPALIYHNMTRERGCALRLSAASRRTQCPGLPSNVSGTVRATCLAEWLRNPPLPCAEAAGGWRQWPRPPYFFLEGRPSRLARPCLLLGRLDLLAAAGPCRPSPSRAFAWHDPQLLSLFPLYYPSPCTLRCPEAFAPAADPCTPDGPQVCEAAGCCYSPPPHSSAGPNGSDITIIRCFLPAGMPPTQFHNDREWFAHSKADDEVVPWFDQVRTLRWRFLCSGPETEKVDQRVNRVEKRVGFAANTPPPFIPRATGAQKTSATSLVASWPPSASRTILPQPLAAFRRTTWATTAWVRAADSPTRAARLLPHPASSRSTLYHSTLAAVPVSPPRQESCCQTTAPSFRRSLPTAASLAALFSATTVQARVPAGVVFPAPIVQPQRLTIWRTCTCVGNLPQTIDIFSDGILGAHGGSGLSAYGGSIRSGELSPNAPPIAHAIKVGAARMLSPHRVRDEHDLGKKEAQGRCRCPFLLPPSAAAALCARLLLWRPECHVLSQAKMHLRLASCCKV